MNSNSKPSSSFTKKFSIKDDGPKLYCVAFHHLDPGLESFFGVAGANEATIYRFHEQNVDIEQLQKYRDADENEAFYTCDWSMGPSSESLFVCAGESGIIKVFNCKKGKLEMALPGHGDCINEVKTHPVKPLLLLSCSKDRSIRLWNLETKTCIIVFAGVDGHQSDIVSLSFHPLDGGYFASSGLDLNIKIWHMSQHDEIIEKSFHWEQSPSSFPTKFVQIPNYSTNRVHEHYVDCVEWYGDFIMTKSPDEHCTLWKPVYAQNGMTDSIELIQQFQGQCCNLWFMKFAIDRSGTFMALGTKNGKVQIWDIANGTRIAMHSMGRHGQIVVRHLAFSYRGHQLVCVSEDGYICIFHN